MTDPYKEEVLGKRCKVYFLMEYDDNKSKMNKKKNNKEQLQAFAGQVTKYKVDWEQKQDTAKREHYVIFDDGDERWLELNQEALHGRVEWLEPVATNASRKRAKHAPPVVRPEKQQKAARRSKMGSEKKEATDKEHSKRARMATSGKSVVQSNGKDAQQAMWTTPGIAVPTTSSLQNDKGAKDDGDPLWLEDFHDWLLTVSHGPKHAKCSEQNADKVMRQVRKLTSGQGIRYKGWVPNVFFPKNCPIVNIMAVNFDRMWDELHYYEAMYGSFDKGGGQIRHPLKKLQLYQAYRKEQQRRKEVKNDHERPICAF